MEKSKRSDLLAAGRKKLLQYRQRKDHKGGNKDAESSSKGSKSEEKDVHVDETTNILEPELATSTSTLDSDASITDSSNPTTSHVNLPTAESAVLVDQGARHDARDPEEVQIELPAGCEVSSLASEINHEEVRRPGSDKCNEDSYGGGVPVPAVDSRMDQADESIPTVALVAERAEGEATIAEPSLDLQASQYLDGLPSQPGERNEAEGDSLSSSVDSKIWFSGMRKRVEDHEIEKSEIQTDVSASANYEAEKAKQASMLTTPAEAAQEVETYIYHGREVIPAHDSTEKTFVHGSTSLGEKSEFSSSLQVTYGNSLLSEQIQKVPSLKNVASDEGIQIKEILEVPFLSQTTADITSSSQNVESPILQENDSAHKEEKVSDVHDEESMEIILGEVTVPPLENVEGLNVEDRHQVSGSRGPVSSLALSYTPTQVFDDNGFVYALEEFGRYLYITNVSRDFLKFQLDEETEFHDEFCKHSSAELSKVFGLLQESQKRNTVANEELTQDRSEIQALIAAKEELEIRLLSREQEFQILNSNFQELHSNLELSQRDLANLSAELVSCRSCLETLQNEHVNLTTSVALETEDRKRIVEEKKFLSSENEKLASDLLEQKEKLCAAIDKQNQLEHIIRERGSYIEQLAEDNLYLSSCLIIHRAKLKELEDEHFESPMGSHEAKCLKTEYDTEGIAVGDVICDVQSTRTLDGQSTLLQNVQDGQPDSFPILKILKGHLQEAKDTLKKLEKSVEGMHSHSVSLKWSDGRSGASGVSRLIQAFESKQTEISEEEVHMLKGGQSDDSYSVTKEQASCLRDTIEQIEMEIAKAEVHITEKWNNRTILKDSQMDSLGLKQKSDTLQVKIDELVDKILKNSSKVHDLQNQFDEIQQDAHDQMGKFFSDIELLQNETKEKCLVLTQERDSLIDVISEARKKLNKYTTYQITGDFDEASHLIALVDAATETFNNLNEKLDAANLNYNTLHNSYDEQEKVLNTALETNKFLIGEMHRVYGSLWNVLTDACQDIGTMDVDMGAEAILQILPERFETAIVHFKKLLSERLLFLSKSNESESMLLTKNREIQELKLEYNGLLKKFDDLQSANNELDSILRKKEEVFVEANRICLSLVSKLDYHRPCQDLRIPAVFRVNDEITQAYDVGTNDFFSSMLQLEALVDFYVQEHEGTIEHVNLSKKCLLEMNIFPDIPDQNWSLPLPTLLRDEFIPKTNELLDQLDFLCMAYIKHEIELQFFEENLSRMKDALDASLLDLHLKMSELEQSEQRLSSVREKLSIAVAKGKGLIVQRDNLKQSLMDKSSELEKCLHELQSKDILLQEVEAKLKSYAEVDRIEALESELSYIRNSATALRDSFLLKDSVLLRIEEILEDLDFPEHFHSRDTVEKIELLSKMVAGNSSISVTDWDQKSCTGGSHSDAGFMVVDSWRDGDGSQAISNSGFDELKAKCETLERKFYVLAEHNDMLEQSLVQRNSVVQKWEEMLDKFEMPPQLSMLEPKDKIEWLGNLLAEVQQERDALQLKIKNLEDSSQMVKVSLEESCKKLSEVYSEAEMIRSEKDLIYEKLDKLKYANLELLEKVAQHDFDKEHFQTEMSDLKDKLANKVQENLHLRNMENEIWRLVDMVHNAFHGSDLSAVLSDGNAINCLEALLQKIVDEYTKLELEKYAPKDATDSVPKDGEELVSKDNSNSGSGDVVRDKDMEFNLMRLELDKATSNFDLLKVERDEFMERCQTLMVEIESISEQPKLLQEEIAAEIEKSKSLLSQLEMMRKEKNALMVQLTQEEEKSASTREKLNIAVRKGKGLVQQRDGLKQEIEEKNIAIAQLRSEFNQQVEALESEKKLLVNQLKETEGSLKNSNQALNRLLQILDNIDIGRSTLNMDPVAKLEEIGKIILDLHSSLVSAENESNKSKRAAELLLAELNEVHERADILQEELENARVALLETSKQRDAADTAKADAFHRLEEISLLHTEERKNQIDNMAQLKSGIGKLNKMYSEISGLLANAFIRDVDFLSYMEIFMESIDIKACKNRTHLPSNNSLHEVNALSELRSCEPPDENSLAENLAFVVRCVLECLRNCNDLKIKIQKHSLSFDEQANRLLKNMEHVDRNFSSQKEEFESSKREVDKLKSTIRDKEKENFEVNQTLSFLYQACNDLITDIENGNSEIADNELVFRGRSMTKSWKPTSEIHGQACADVNSPSLTYDVISSLIEKLILMVNGRKSYETAELKETISHLRRELQEKDAHTSRIAAELVSQIRDAESAAKKSLTELDSAKMTIFSLEKQLEAMDNDKKSLELRVAEQRDLEAMLNELNGNIKSLNDTLAAKDQEIEALMEALDEEEAHVEDLENRNKELKNIVEERTATSENLEASHEKTRVKLSTTVTKFDELYNLSESLLAEVENLQSQLHNQESEISFLRQEVTRCTNELLASQESDKKHSSEVHDLHKWFDMTISRYGLSNVRMNSENTQIHVYTDILDQSIASIMNELDDLRKKVTQQKRRTLTGPSEVEQMVQKPEPGPAGVVTHMRSGRKFNNDQIAIAIDTEKDGNVIDDEDDDKAHGFKSLTMSRFVPRVSRPIAEKIDGIWVSGDRLLMRQPTLRLGVLLYWVALHALLASFI